MRGGAGDFLRDLLTGQVEPELAVTHATAEIPSACIASERAVSGLKMRTPSGLPSRRTSVSGMISPSRENTVYERAICSSEADRP